MPKLPNVGGGQRCPLQWPPSVHCCSTRRLVSWCRTYSAATAKESKESKEPCLPQSFRNKSYQAGICRDSNLEFGRFSCDSAWNWKFQLFVSHFWVFCLIFIVALGKTLKWQPAFGRTRCTNWCDGVWRCRIGHCCCRTFGSFKAGIKGNGAQLWWIQTCGWWQAGASVCGAETGGFLYEVIVML